MKKFKVVLLGEAGVGKSAIALRLVKNEWIENSRSTVGASFFKHIIDVDSVTMHFDIWDTAGQERYKSLASMYYRGAAAALVVYDITSQSSFVRAQEWIQELKENAPDALIALIGNKSDLSEQRAVGTNETVEFSNKK